VEVFTVAAVASTAAEVFMVEVVRSTAVEDSVGAEAALPVAGTMVTVVAFAEEPHRTWVIHIRTADPAGTHPIRLEIPPSPIDFVPVQVA
jgi:hypothetical protein